MKHFDLRQTSTTAIVTIKTTPFSKKNPQHRLKQIATTMTFTSKNVTTTTAVTINISIISNNNKINRNDVQNNFFCESKQNSRKRNVVEKENPINSESIDFDSQIRNSQN